MGRGRHSRSHAFLARGVAPTWLTAAALATCVTMIVALLGLIVWQGMGTFWPRPVAELTLADGATLLGEVSRTETRDGARRRLLRTANYDVVRTHFTWVADADVVGEDAPTDVVVLERRAWGRLQGRPEAFEVDGQVVAEGPRAWNAYEQRRGAAHERRAEAKRIETHGMAAANDRLERARVKLRAAELKHGVGSARWSRAKSESESVAAETQGTYESLREKLQALREENARYALVLELPGGVRHAVPVAEIVRGYAPNAMSSGEKLRLYASRWWEFLSDVPRSANSEGGVFPAIFGTVLMTLLMCVMVVPFGVLAALYLREYAKDGFVTSALRVAVNNLAGVPSIVYGVFGLGFFCYGIGGLIDGGPTRTWSRGAWIAAFGTLVAVVAVALAGGYALPRARSLPDGARKWATRAIPTMWGVATLVAAYLVLRNPFFHGFYAASLPNPTFGKGALVWASLTLALLTLPVVIVATEEALAAVPNSMREGSYACGAGKLQTIVNIVLPRAMPGILTGVILAMARGAGEVAPLMLVGAVKLAPELPIAAEWPFGFNRSFMHLGFHIYDLGFQSQNAEAAKPMVYTTTFLLVSIVTVLNVSGTWLRARLRGRSVVGQF